MHRIHITLRALSCIRHKCLVTLLRSVVGSPDSKKQSMAMSSMSPCSNSSLHRLQAKVSTGCVCHSQIEVVVTARERFTFVFGCENGRHDQVNTNGSFYVSLVAVFCTCIDCVDCICVSSAKFKFLAKASAFHRVLVLARNLQRLRPMIFWKQCLL